MSGLLGDYSRQALSYDDTRAASPSVLGPLRTALAGAPGRRLADIGGGTGNYAAALAAEGWRPLVLDRSEQMLARAGAKGLDTLRADAQSLPIQDESFDAAMLVSMLHHVDDRRIALEEAARILRPDGRLAVLLFTREDVADLWFLDLFPSSRAWMEETHPPLAEVLDALPGAERVEVVFDDLIDGSVAALAGRPDCVVQESFRSSTSYFERLARDHAEELAEGIARLERQLAAGTAPAEPGRGSLVVWRRAA
jgi:ubiquinone/menaquinone biosynthesis C-methylase UbiE